MEKFLFEDVEGFVDKFLEEYENYENDKDFDGISIVAHYGHIRDILNYLVKNTCFEVYDVELKTYESDFYRDEYTLVVDEDKKIWCQKAKFDTGYLHLEEKVIFVHSDVNSQFAIKNKSENMIEFDFGTEEETECDYKQCSRCPHIPLDSNTSVSTYGISEYYINGKPVNKETFIEYQADYEKYFQSAMSEMSKFLKLLNW